MLIIKLFVKDKYWLAIVNISLLKKPVFLEITYRRFNDDFRVRVNKMRPYSMWVSKLYMNAKIHVLYDLTD